MKLRLLLTLLILLPWATSASAAPLQDCNQIADLRRKISGCTQLLKTAQPQQRHQIIALRGIGFMRLYEFDRAMADFDEAVRLNPKSKDALIGRAEVRSKMGQPERASEDLQEAIRLYPNDATVRGVSGFARLESGDLGGALLDFGDAIRLAPQNAVFNVLRAYVWREKGEYDKALADCDEAIRKNPKDSHAYASRGTMWRLKGDLDRALIDQASRFASVRMSAIATSSVRKPIATGESINVRWLITTRFSRWTPTALLLMQAED